MELRRIPGPGSTIRSHFDMPAVNQIKVIPLIVRFMQEQNTLCRSELERGLANTVNQHNNRAMATSPLRERAKYRPGDRTRGRRGRTLSMGGAILLVALPGKKHASPRTNMKTEAWSLVLSTQGETAHWQCHFQ
jgi:hypothetical protein